MQINSEISAKYNIGTYGNNGHEVQSKKGKVLFISNTSNDSYTNWLLAVDFAKSNTNLIEGVKTFKNKHFVKRDYESTNVVFCEAEAAPNENWIECEPEENKLDQLYIQGNVKYFGYL